MKRETSAARIHGSKRNGASREVRRWHLGTLDFHALLVLCLFLTFWNHFKYTESRRRAQRIFFVRFHLFVQRSTTFALSFLSRMYVWSVSMGGYPAPSPGGHFPLQGGKGDPRCRAHLFGFLLSSLLDPANPHYFVSSLMPLKTLF